LGSCVSSVSPLIVFSPFGVNRRSALTKFHNGASEQLQDRHSSESRSPVNSAGSRLPPG
jgi:hypothetical protein